MKKILTIILIIALVAIALLSGCKPDIDIIPEKDDDYPSEIPATTKPLDDYTTSNLISYKDGVLIFNENTGLESIVAGDIIVDEVSVFAPSGILARVVEISPDKRTIHTEPTTLENAIKSCFVTFSNRLASSRVASVNLERSVADRSISDGYDFSLNLENLILHDADGNLDTINDQIVANGEFSFNLNVGITLKIKDFKLEKFNFENTINENLELEITGTISIPHKSVEIKLAEYNFTPFVATIIPSIPPFPIVIAPKLEVYVNFDAELNSSITTKVTQNAELTCGLNYENESWIPVNNLENNFIFLQPQLTENASVKISTGARLKMLLYGISGPYGDISGYTRVEADINENPWLTLYGGLEAKVGVNVSVLGHTLADYSRTVINYEKILMEVKENTDSKPAAPSNLQLAIVPGTSVVKATWTDNSDNEDYFYLYLSTDNFQTLYLSNKVPMNYTSVNTSSLEQGETYYFRVYATNENGDSDSSNIASITILDSYPDTVIKTINVGDGPSGIEITLDEKYVYVTNYHSNSISIIKISDSTIVKTVNTNGPTTLAITPDGKYVYVVNSDTDIISVLQTSDDTIIKTINVGNGPSDIEITPDGKYIYVVNLFADTVSIIGSANNTIIKTINVGYRPSGIAVTPTDEYMYISNYLDDVILVIKISDNTIIKTINVGDGPSDIEITPDGKYIYVTNSSSNNVSVIETSNNVVTKTINVGSSPHSPTITLDAKYLYVTNYYSNTLSVIRISDNQLVDTINVGDSPIDIATTQDNRYIYVINSGSDTISVIGF